MKFNQRSGLGHQSHVLHVAILWRCWLRTTSSMAPRVGATLWRVTLPDHLFRRPASGTPLDGGMAVRSGVQGGGGSRIFWSSGHHPAFRRATNVAQLAPVHVPKLLSSTFYTGARGRPEENYVHRGCVFNSLIMRNSTPDPVQYSKTARPLYKWRELRPAPVCLL